MFIHTVLPALVAILFSNIAAAMPAAGAIKTCAVCPPSIFFSGQTRFLSLSKEDGGNTLDCAYTIPAIQGMIPFCLYANLGPLVGSNAAGACPPTATVETQNDPRFPSCTAEPVPIPPHF